MHNYPVIRHNRILCCNGYLLYNIGVGIVSGCKPVCPIQMQKGKMGK